jgi:cell division protein ZapA
MKQIEVTIMGQSYILGCPEGGESSLLEAVGNVDREMSAIRDGGRVKARERIAVLAALNLAYALAERPAAPKSSPAPASAAASTSQPSASEPSNVDDIDIDALIHRVDQALGADGQLL